MVNIARRRALGEFLRKHRELASEPVTRKQGRKRRTPGLRREEVALAAGISPTWYARLEQGKEVMPSAGALKPGDTPATGQPVANDTWATPSPVRSGVPGWVVVLVAVISAGASGLAVWYL